MGTELLHAISLDPRGVLDAGNQTVESQGTNLRISPIFDLQVYDDA